jgi:hypothetical protein
MTSFDSQLIHPTNKATFSAFFCEDLSYDLDIKIQLYHYNVNCCITENLMNRCPQSRWLLLIHQIPPKPAYFRVKIWRRLQTLGAVAVKNSVYVIPRNHQTLEDFHWALREIVQGGGEASICEASFVEGLTDEQVEGLFREARDADYAEIENDARALLDSLPAPGSSLQDDRIAELSMRLARLKRRFSGVIALDFFKALGRENVDSLIALLEARLKEAEREPGRQREESAKGNLMDLTGRTWVTRKGVYVDRIASAWLIRRFVDPDARFKFVSDKGYKLRPGELRFDMFEGEFTHAGDLCTFEVLSKRFAVNDQALAEIGKVIHDLDLKDTKFNMPETPGIGGLIEGLASAHRSDESRLERGAAIFDDLYEYFQRK